MKIVAIHQPNYAPWCGFFAKIAHSDTFIFLDDVQMPGGSSWVHRTKILVGGADRWLSVPCHRSVRAAIKDVRIKEGPWSAKHLNTLQANYAKAPHFPEVMELIHGMYMAPADLLAEFNIGLIQAIVDYLGLQTKCRLASALPSQGTSEDRLVSLVRAVEGDRYLSGPGATAYQSPETFARAGIELQVREYVPRAYPQRATAEFIGGLSILDALFHCGRDANALLTYDDIP